MSFKNAFYCIFKRDDVITICPTWIGSPQHCICQESYFIVHRSILVFIATVLESYSNVIFIP